MSGYPPPPNQAPYPQYPPQSYPPPQGPPQYPPQYGGYPPPPVQPPRKSDRGAIIGVGALLAAIIIAVGGVFIVKGRSAGTPTATPPPSVSATSASSILSMLSGGSGRTGASGTPAAPVASDSKGGGGSLFNNLAAAATRAASGGVAIPATAGTGPTATTGQATRPATSPATVPATRSATSTTGSSGGPVTFIDPGNLLKLQYPGSWTQQDLNSNDNGNVLNIASPENAASFYLSIYSPPFGTIDAEIQDLRANDAKNSKFTITDGPVADAKVGGEPAKTYTFTYVRKDNPSATPFTGQVWEVNYNGREFYLNASPIGTRKAEVDALVASIAFTTGAAAPGQSTTWTDPKGYVKLQYPSSWSVTTDSTDPNNILRLQSPDGSYFYIDFYDPQTGTIDKEIQDFRDVRMKSTNFTNTLGPVADTKIGGEPAKTYPFTYVSKSNPSGPSNNARDYEVNHGGKEFAISASPIGSHAAEMDAIVASITFLR